MSKKSGAIANENQIASMGGFGCKYFDVSTATALEPDTEGRYISAIHVFEDTVLDSVDASWDAPADDMTNVTIPEGNCIYLKAKKVTISSGSGIIYYGCGTVS